MRQQLSEIKMIDQYILCALSAEDKILMDARMILSPVLKRNFFQQVKLHQVVVQHGREQLRARLNHMHTRLMRNPGFSREIQSHFK